MAQTNVAIKCTHNNGGEGEFVGFAGTCTEDIIKYNIDLGHIWCSHNDCACKQYYDKGFIGRNKPNSPCMESVLFKKWVYGSGWFHKGPHAGNPRRANIESGGIAILTTRFPNQNENDRKIIGLYKIDHITNNDGEETKLYADNKLKIRLPLDEANELYFWDYYSVNYSKPTWGTGLFRYLNEGQTKLILEDLNKTVRSNEHREIIYKLIEDVKEANSNGVKGLRKSKISRDRRIAFKRKYGPGGEGENHKRLKKWISKNPTAINISDAINCEMEYSFCCGDTVDLLFERKNGKDVVVEIETDYPQPGAHQAIKYRALRCAERALRLSDERVKSVLVAWYLPDELKKFCNKYNIEAYEIKK